MGVPCVRVVDPYSPRAWIFEADRPPVEVQDGSSSLLVSESKSVWLTFCRSRVQQAKRSERALSPMHMPPQEEHEKPENLVEAPGEAEQAARSLQDAADSHHTLQGFFAVNNERPPEGTEEQGASDDIREDREKGHPVP